MAYGRIGKAVVGLMRRGRHFRKGLGQNMFKARKGSVPAGGGIRHGVFKRPGFDLGRNARKGSSAYRRGVLARTRAGSASAVAAFGAGSVGLAVWARKRRKRSQKMRQVVAQLRKPGYVRLTNTKTGRSSVGIVRPQ